MTPIQERIAAMRRIVDAAGDRDLTQSQTADFRAASRDVLDHAADRMDRAAVTDLAGTMKSADGIPAVVDAFEAWAARHNGGRVSAGRTIIENDGPLGRSYGAGLRSSYKSALSWGAEFEEARGYTAKGLLETGSVPVSVPLAAQPFEDARQAKFVYQLCQTEDAPDGHFGYLKQIARTNNAAVVATGALKPESDFTLERVDDYTKVIAHLTGAVDKFLLEDAPMLRQFLDRELQYGLQRALDARVVSAISTAAGAGAVTPDLAGIRSAITDLQLLDLAPTGIVISPTDWETVETEASTTFAANDNMPAANDAFARRLYGVNVMVSNSINPGLALVGDFAGSAVLYNSGSAQISIHDSHPRTVEAATVADFQLNQITMRAEMRAEIAVVRPDGFVLVGAGS